MARKTIKGSIISNFYTENPIEGKDSKEDFPNEDILDVLNQDLWQNWIHNHP